MKTTTCFFIGHRDAPEDLRPLLSDAVERHIMQYGVTEFIVGYYGCFDAMAASAVRASKQQHPEISLVLLIPYYPYPNETKDYDATFYHTTHFHTKRTALTPPFTRPTWRAFRNRLPSSAQTSI